ncbi:MAG: TonB-dependent siderophore receptor [Gammaproteobacteria bacterium]
MKSLIACAVLLSTAAVAATPAFAQNAAERTYRLDIPAQPLDTALLQFAETTGLQLIYSAEVARGMRSPGVKGEVSAQAGLQRLLSESSLVFRITASGAITIESSKSDGKTRVMGPVRVEGAEGTALAGVNGSTDPTATEGTGSYTSSSLSIASKSPQSIKDTAESVSVITQQRMRDQNLTDFSSLMNQATGVTLVQGGANGTSTNLETAFYSRGFAIGTIQLDGGAPLATLLSGGDATAYVPLIDMAQYDHVELLRGADGLFNGYGGPGGSVNLVRKRPLDHGQVLVEGAGGSWGNYRVMVDASAPLGFDGKLRGRAVVSYQDQDYFYDVANNNHTLTYGVVEADLTPTTVVSAGFSLTRQDAVPWSSGLMRYRGGASLGLPRSTCLCLGWNRWDFDTKELFASADRILNEDWSIKVNLTRNDQESHNKYGYVAGSVNNITLAGPALYGSMNDYSSVQTLADLTLSGSFELFGHRQQILLGGNWQDVDGGGQRRYGTLWAYPYPAINDVFNFDRNNLAYREPGTSEASYEYPAYGQRQWGLYTNVNLTLWEPLHLITGLRYGHYEYNNTSQSLCTTPNVARNVGGCAVVGQPWPSLGLTRTLSSGHDLSWPPKVSLVYSPAKDWSAYASYTDIYVSQANYLDVDHSPIKPLTGGNMEAGLKFEGFSGKLNASIAAYRIEQKNFRNQVTETNQDLGDGTWCCFSNGLDFKNLSQGLDAEVTGEVGRGWQVFAGYTYNQNEYKGADAGTTEGLPLVSRSPKHLLKLTTSYQFQGGEWLHRLNIGGGVNAQTSSYNSGTVCLAFNPDTGVCRPASEGGGTASYEFTQGVFAVFSGRIGYQIDSQWNLALNVNNLTDKVYYQTMGTASGGNWYGEPRSYMLTVRGSF